MLHAESKQNALFDKKLAEEERWIRQGIKARRTRNEGRVRALIALRKTLPVAALSGVRAGLAGRSAVSRGDGAALWRGL